MARPILTVSTTFATWQSDAADYLITKGVFKYFFNRDRTVRGKEYQPDPFTATPQTMEQHEELCRDEADAGRFKGKSDFFAPCKEITCIKFSLQFAPLEWIYRVLLDETLNRVDQ